MDRASDKENKFIIFENDAKCSKIIKDFKKLDTKQVDAIEL